MSNNVDKRIVEMQFDNKQFEKGVQESVKSLDTLKKSLDLEKSAKGLAALEKAGKSFSLDGISSGVETISSRFTSLGIIGVTALQRITNAALDCGKKMISALTIDPVKTGFSEYETQINAIQTILSNTRDAMTKQGYSDQERLDIVNDRLDQLNHYADKTIYNFTEMTRNIGTFTAAGVELDTAVQSIQGIANLAAVSGSTSEQASRAMYQLSQALSSGTVKLTDWNSVVNSGMGGELFQKALIRTANAMHKTVDYTVTETDRSGKKIKKTVQRTVEECIAEEGSFRDSLSKGWLTSDVLTATLEQFSYDFEQMAKDMGYTAENMEEGIAAAMEKTRRDLIASGYTKEEADEIVQLARDASEAATKVKTFTQLFDTLKEAAQSGWTQTWEYIIGDFEEAKAFLTSVSDFFGGIIEASSEARNKVVSEWKDLGGRDQLIEGFWNIVYAIQNIVNSFKGTFQKFFPPTTGKQLFNITKSFNEMTKRIRAFTENAEVMSKVEKIFGGAASAMDLLRRGLKWVWTGFKNLLGVTKPIGSIFLNLVSSFGEFITSIHDSIGTSKVFQGILNGLSDTASSIGRLFVSAFNAIAKVFGKLAGKVRGSNVLTKMGESVSGFLSKLPEGIDKLHDWGKGIVDYVKNSETLKTAYENTKNFLSPMIDKVQDFAKKFKDNILGLSKKESEPKGGWTNVTGLWDKLKEKIGGVGESMSSWFGSVASKIKTGWTNIRDFFSKLFGETIPGFFSKTLPAFVDKIGTGSLNFVDWLTKLITPFANLYLMFKGGTALGAIGKLPKAMKGMSESLEGIAKEFSKIGSGFEEIGKKGLTITKVDKKKDSIGNTLLKIASAITMLVGSIWLLSKMKTDDILKGLSIIGIIAAELFAISLLFMKVQTNTKAFLGMAAAVTLLLIPIKMLSAMEWGDALKGIGLVGVVLGELAIFMRMAGSGFTGKTGFLGLSISVNILIIAIKRIADMDTGAAMKGVMGLGAILFELALFMRMAGKGFTGKTGFLSLSIAVNLLVLAMKGLAKMSIGSLAKSLVALEVLLLELSRFMKKTASVGKVSGLLAMAAAINLMVRAVKKMGNMKISTLAKGVAGLGGMMVAFGVMLKATKGMKIKDSLLTLVTLAGTLILFIEAFKQVEDMKTDKMLAFALSFSAMLLAFSVAIKFIGEAKHPIKAALAGIASFALLIVGIGAIVAALGWLQQKWPKLNEFLEVGGELLGGIGWALGKFIGGIGVGITSDIPQIGTNLSDFMTNLEPFLNKAKGVGSNVVTGIKYLASAMTSISGAEFVNAVASWFVGQNPITKFSTDIGTIGTTLKNFADGVAAFADADDGSTSNTTSAVQNATAAAEGLASLAKAVPWDLPDWAETIFGEKNTEKFKTDVEALATALVNYTSAIQPLGNETVDQTAIDNANTIAAGLVSLESSLQRTGGSWQGLTGIKDLSGFAGRLPGFAEGMKAYAENIDGFDKAPDDDDISNSTKIAAGLVALENSLSRKGGAWQGFIGTKDLESFAGEMPSIASSLMTYAENINGFSSSVSQDDITNSTAAATGLVALAKTLPREGGWWQGIVGVKDLGNFAGDVKAMGEGLAAFAEGASTAKIDETQNAISVLEILKTFVDDLDPTGSIWDKLAEVFGKGSKFETLQSYVNSLGDLGTTLSKFSSDIQSLNSGQTDQAFSILTSIQSFTDGLEKSGGILDSIGKAITGDKFTTLQNYTGALRSLGEDLYSFSTNIQLAKTTDVDKASGIIGVIQTFIGGLEKSGGFLESIGAFFKGTQFSTLETAMSAMANFGTNFKTFSDGIVNAASTETNFTIAKRIFDSFKSFGGEGTGWEDMNTEGINAAIAFIGGLNTGLEDGANSVSDSAGSVANTGAAGASDQYMSWYYAGQNLAIGLGNGISSETGFIRTKAIEVANAAISAVRVTWDEHSPSRVGYGLGANFDFGLAGGLDGYAKVVSASAVNVSKGAITSAQIMLADLSSVLAGGIDPTPTIRPVLDLSNIQNGVGLIDGMFNGSRSIGMNMFNGGSFLRGAGALNFDGAKIVGGMSNKDVVTEIQNLNERMTDLANAVTNMQLVLDTGTLVGATSSKMDNEFGTLAMRRGRGN